MRNLQDWEIADVLGDTMTFWKCVDANTGRRLVFVCQGTDIEYDDGEGSGTSGGFASFTIDGRAPTDEEEDEHSDDLRALIRDIYLDD